MKRKPLCSTFHFVLVVAFLAGIGLTTVVYENRVFRSLSFHFRSTEEEAFSLSSNTVPIANSSSNAKKRAVQETESSTTATESVERRRRTTTTKKTKKTAGGKTNGGRKTSEALPAAKKTKAEIAREAKRQRHLKYYHDRFGYTKPLARTTEEDNGETTTPSSDLCGEAPLFENYFNLDKLYRSRLDEDQLIYQHFFQNQKKKGIYIEMGAFNGIRESNSRFFDECLGWEGVLIEANPLMKRHLLKNRPHAHRLFYAPSCSLEQERQKATVEFAAVRSTMAGLRGTTGKDSNTVRVPCGTLTNPLVDIFPNNQTISFFSLDVEGAEPLVLRNLDLDAVRVEIFMIESENKQCRGGDCVSREEVRQILVEQYNYALYPNVIPKSDLYLHPSLPPFQPTTAGASVPQQAVVPAKTTNVPEARLQMYKDRYNYHEPEARGTSDVPCGASPDYKTFFKLKNTERSRSNEDRTIFQTFFQQRGDASPGVYVEMGAYNGKKESNTRFFDECLGWDGLLVEPNPIMTQQVIDNRPHAHRLFYAPSCTEEEENNGKTISFVAEDSTRSSIEGIDAKAKAKDRVEVPCGSLTNVLLDLFPNRHIDFYSLDVEGAEPLILRNLDLNAVTVDVLIAENINRMCQEDCPAREEVRQIMVNEYNYALYPDVVERSDLFIHPDVHANMPSEWLDSHNQMLLDDDHEEDDPDKAKRMEVYFERYQYKEPTSRTDDGGLDCGVAPNYKTFFGLKNTERSRSNEDLTVFETFFKQHKGRGVYVEMGAYNGKKESNTRFFDECLGWDGLLVEPNPIMTQQVIDNRPHAHRLFYAPSCTEEEEKNGKTISFVAEDSTRSSIEGIDSEANAEDRVEVPCGSLTNVLLDLFPNRHINFYSLDVEGAEPMILRNLDLNVVTVDVLIAENVNRMCQEDCPAREEVRRIMVLEYNYALYPDVVERSDLFIHPDVHTNMPSEWLDTHTQMHVEEDNPEKAKRMEVYRERYQHNKPQPRSNGNKLDCGVAPNYNTFFNLKNTERSRSNEDLTIFETFFKEQHQGRGVYVEMGAYNGKKESNTRFFDECLGWDGLLVEPNPIMTQQVIDNRPHAHRLFYAPSCTEEEEKNGKTISFVAEDSTRSSIEGIDSKANAEDRVEVPCGSLTNVLLDLFPNRHINFYSLDVEGAEPLILRNLDLNAVTVDVLIAENINRMCQEDCPAREEVRKIMVLEYNYALYPDVVERSDLFIHPDMHAKMPSEWLTRHSQMHLEGDNPEKAKRMEVYRERYQYNEPQSRNDDGGLDCGLAPNYNTFFNLKNTERSRSNEDLTVFETFFKEQHQGRGVYVEMGAYNGKKESNTRFFDECLGWDGLLVEPNPIMTQQVIDNRPHAHRLFYAPSCTEEEEKNGKTISFVAEDSTRSSIEGIDSEANAEDRVEVPCGSLTNVLLDLFPNRHINFYSLDVEGAEPLILRNLDLNAVTVDVLIAENINRMCQDDCPAREEVRRIMVKEYNYALYPYVVERSDLFIHPDMHAKMPSEWVEANYRLTLSDELPSGAETVNVSTGDSTRMQLYKERYHYEQPQERTEADALSCGVVPSYQTYFSLDDTQRSRKDEDLTVYNTFFIQREEKGVYVEMGAFDGMRESNSRFFDECLGWDGLLVEPNPLMRSKVIKNRPHAHRMFYAPSCSEEEEASGKTVAFRAAKSTQSSLEGIDEQGEGERDLVEVPCGSLTNVFLDLFPGRHINFFSLDVEGAEPLILKNLDLNAVTVEVLIAENYNRMCQEDCPAREEVRRIMVQEYNYIVYPEVVERSDLFIHPSVHQNMPPTWIEDNKSLPLTDILTMVKSQ